MCGTHEKLTRVEAFYSVSYHSTISKISPEISACSGDAAAASLDPPIVMIHRLNDAPTYTTRKQDTESAIVSFTLLRDELYFKNT